MSSPAPIAFFATRLPPSHLYLGCGIFVFGCALQMQETALSSLWVYVGAVGVSVLIFSLWFFLWQRESFSFCRRWLSALLVCLCAITLGLGWAGWRATLVMQDRIAAQWVDTTVRVEGVVESMVQVSERGIRFRLSLDRATHTTTVPLPATVMVYWNSGPSTDDGQAWTLQTKAPVVVPGDRWQLTMRLSAVHGASNPGGFDYELWMWEQGIGAIGSVKKGELAVLKERGWIRPIERVRQAVRDRLFAHFEQAFVVRQEVSQDEEMSRFFDEGAGRWVGVIAALVVGDQSAISRSDWELYRATGLAHLVSISGLHITMFALAAGALVGVVWRRSSRLCLCIPSPLAAAVGGFGLAFFYAVFSGWALPAQRTIVMLALSVVLKCTAIRWPWIRVWLLALVIVVVMDPWAILAPGFWLSFVAVGVLLASDSGRLIDAQETVVPYEENEGCVRTSLWRRLLQSMRRLCIEQVVVTVGLAPLTLYLFQQQSVVGLVANLLAGPWMTLVVTPLGLAGVVLSPAWTLAAYALQLEYEVLHVLARMPFANFGVAVAPLWISVAGMVGAALVVMPTALPVRVLGVPLMMCVVLWQAQRPETGHFEVVFADIGQGNAVIVRTLAHTLVYDTGPKYSDQADAGQRIVVPLLRLSAESPDVLMLSHQDADHAGGALSVLNAYPSVHFLTSVPKDHVLASIKPVQPCISHTSGGQQWQWDGVEFEVLHPDASDYLQAMTPNAMSCVLRISNGDKTVLLVGDLEAAQEDRLVATVPEKLSANVLLVPHHGSKTSSTGIFLDAVAPDVAVVQAGYGNRYGHPAERVMQRYDGRGIRVVETSFCGALTWRSSHGAPMDCNRLLTMRYWHHKPEPRVVGPRYPIQNS